MAAAERGILEGEEELSQDSGGRSSGAQHRCSAREYLRTTALWIEDDWRIGGLEAI